MATYIHKHGPDTGNILLEEYELGISNGAYGYTKIGSNVTPLRVKESDLALNIQGTSGVIPTDEIFLKTGTNQTVTDPNPTFNNQITVTNKVVCPIFEGTATKAKYADLAENYETDDDYEVGTVLFYGEDVEASIKTARTKAPIGIVSENPGYLLNDEPDFKKYVPIALKGRVKVKVQGEAKRGDILVADRENPGFAKVDNNALGVNILGICLNPSKDGYCEIKV